MKIRPLPTDDLVRIAPLATDSKRKALANVLTGRPPFSYKPLRLSLNDLMNVQHRLLAIDEPPLQAILNQVGRASRSDAERAANLELTRLIHSFMKSDDLRAQHEEFRSIPLGVGIFAGYCTNAVIIGSDGPMIVGFNLRRTLLTGMGLRFALSLMQEQSKALNPDLASASLQIVQFPQPKPKGSPRQFMTSTQGAVPLFSYEQITGMATETYSIWNELQAEQAERTRRTGTDDVNWWGTE